MRPKFGQKGPHCNQLALWRTLLIVKDARWKTYSHRELLRQVRRDERAGLVPDTSKMQYERPVHRGDCAGGPRPCPFVACAHHLFLEVKHTGALRFPYGDDVEALSSMDETCALDVADEGPTTLERVGELMLITRERVRQIEDGAMNKLKQTADAQFAKDEHGILKPRES